MNSTVWNRKRKLYLVPYLIDKDGIHLIMATIKEKFKKDGKNIYTYSLIGGNCDKKGESDEDCISREACEETGEILNLPSGVDLKQYKLTKTDGGKITHYVFLPIEGETRRTLYNLVQRVNESRYRNPPDQEISPSCAENSFLSVVNLSFLSELPVATYKATQQNYFNVASRSHSQTDWKDYLDLLIKKKCILYIWESVKHVLNSKYFDEKYKLEKFKMEQLISDELKHCVCRKKPTNTVKKSPKNTQRWRNAQVKTRSNTTNWRRKNN